MEITIDNKAGASYIVIDEDFKMPIRTKELADGVYGDYDAADKLVGIEILSVLEVEDITEGRE